MGSLRVRFLDIDAGAPLPGAYAALSHFGGAAIAAGTAGPDGGVDFASVALELAVYRLDLTLDVPGGPRAVFATLSTVMRIEDPRRDHEVTVERSRFGAHVAVTRSADPAEATGGVG